MAYARQDFSGKLLYFGGVQGWYLDPGGADPNVPVPDPLWKGISMGVATGNQFPSNMWRDNFCLNFYQQTAVLEGLTWLQRIQIAHNWCTANGASGPTIQLFYNDNETPEEFIAYLQAIAPYAENTYQIVANELTDPAKGPLAALGGAGSTGWDGLAGMVKLCRQYLPASCKLGLNDFNAADYSSGNTLFNQAKQIAQYQACASLGEPLDWVGIEGYHGNYSKSGGVTAYLSALQTLCETINVPAMYTEFTPFALDNTGFAQIYTTLLMCIQMFLQAFVASKYVFGVTMPWIGFRKSETVYAGTGGPDLLNWLYNDLNDGATNGDGTSANITPTLTWLQSYIPKITGGLTLPPSKPPVNLLSPPSISLAKAVYPTFSPKNELGYRIGKFDQFVPPWLADTVMIRPYGEYGAAPFSVHTKLNGGYWYNAQSPLNDPGALLTTDLDYIIRYDLSLLPGVKKVILAFHWYTSLDQGNVATSNIVPAIGPEVQAWNWDTPPLTGEYLVNPWTRANAYYLKATHQVWPTPDDNAFYKGFEYLQNSGYQVGLCPIVTLMSNNFYYPGGGEWEVDRSLKVWTVANQAAFTAYLNAYRTMYHHYIDLFSQSTDAIPWIIYLGYGMRDITGCGVSAFLVQFVQMLQDLADYCKTKLPNTLVTYAADLDEYFYPYQVNANINNLDPLWTCSDLDFVGINWIAPLALDDTEDNKVLEQGVLQGEADTFNLMNFKWRGSTTDRLSSTTTRNFKTGLTQVPIAPLNRGVKEIIDWLSYYHYYPAINGVLAGCTPLANMFPGDTRLCSHLHGLGPVGSNESLSPEVGGLAPIPNLPDTWMQVQIHSYMFLTLPGVIPDNSTFAFEINFEIDPTLTDLTGNYRIFDSSFGLKLDSIDGTITLWIPTITSSLQEVSLFSAAKGSISLVYTETSVQISVNGAYDLTVSPGDTFFQMPGLLDTMWLGNPQTAGVLPAGYGVWQGKLYFLSLILGVGDNQSGGQFFFDDTYCGIRTAWTPNLKPWMATSFGYGSVRGSAVDPQTRAQMILSNQASVVPNWYDDYQGVSSAIFRNNFKIKDIQGPYGSDFSIDDIYQAIVLNAAALGIIDAGAVHQVAWFFDTRNGGAYKALMPNGQQIFNDAYDYKINSALNGKAAVRNGGSSLIYVPETTVSEDLGLSTIPGDLPYQKVILVEANVPQV